MAADDDELMREAMRGVVPLADRERVVKKPDTATRPTQSKKLQFAIDGDEGRAYGVNEKQLAMLRSGGFGVGHEVDLHRTHAEAARQLIAKHIVDATASGVRCVLVIHGRGTHSAGAPVLRDVVVDVLTKGTCAKHVLAFCPALPKHGGGGAVYVLLRRR